MRIDSESNVNIRNVPVTDGDKIIANMEKQIGKLEERIREIMADEDIPADIKQEQKKQIELQITILRQQILARQRMLQQKKMKQAADERADMESSAGQPVSMSEAKTQAFFSADSAMTQIKAKTGVRVDLECKARTMGNEILTDAARGVDVTGKISGFFGIEARLDSITTDMADDMGSVQESLDAAEEMAAEKEDEEGEAARAQKKRQYGVHIDAYI